jgi:biopolymer transport protein ExbD
MVVLPEHKWGEKTLIPQPNAESMERNPPSPIVIQLKDVGESQRPVLKMNQEEISWDTLESRLMAAFKFRIDRVAFVRADPEVDFEYVAQAVDITHHAGADRDRAARKISSIPEGSKKSFHETSAELSVNKRVAGPHNSANMGGPLA